MPLPQVDPSIKEISETFSSGASPILSEKLWTRSQNRTEWTNGFEDVVDVVSFSPDGIVASLNEEHSTRAEGPTLSQRDQLYRRWQQDLYPSLLETFKGRLQKIAEREDNWDGKGSKKPSSLVLSNAHVTLEHFLYSIVNSGRLWKTPFVSSDEDGHVTIQWNSGNHELHLEIREEGTEYIKVWGANVENDMHLGILKPEDFFKLWDWLNE